MRKAGVLGCLAVVILCLGLAAAVFGDRLVYHAVRYGLQKAFPQYEISLASASIRTGSLVLQGIKAHDKKISLEGGEAQVSFIPLDINARIAVIRLQKLAIKDVVIDFDEKNGGRLHGSALDGTIEGRFQIDLKRNRAYELDLTLQQLSLPVLVSDLKFADKMSATGKFFGTLAIRGNKLGVESIDGTLSGSEPGGDLVILDEAFLGNIANRMNQPLELVKAGLKEYHYDSGQARLLKNGHDLGLELSLDGPKGKRRLNTVFHEAV